MTTYLKIGASDREPGVIFLRLIVSEPAPGVHSMLYAPRIPPDE